jgi:hypothetical protein
MIATAAQTLNTLPAEIKVRMGSIRFSPRRFERFGMDYAPATRFRSEVRVIEELRCRTEVKGLALPEDTIATKLKAVAHRNNPSEPKVRLPAGFVNKAINSISAQKRASCASSSQGAEPPLVESSTFGAGPLQCNLRKPP